MEDKERIVSGQPWSFDCHLITLTCLKEDQQPSELTFTSCPFWVRVYDVPFGKREPALAKKIRDSMGGFLEFDDSDPLHYER